jgi:hypothetical protein
MSNEIYFPSYIWKDTLIYENKDNLVNKIIGNFYEINLGSKYFDPKLTSAFMYEYLNVHEFKENYISCINDQLVSNLATKISIKFEEYLKFYNFSTRFYIRRLWSALYSDGKQSKKHNHTHCTFSGIYYLNLKEDSSGTIFHNNYFWDDFKIDTSILIDVKEDDIIIFPSRYLHSTKVHSSENFRIVISFDIFCPDLSYASLKSTKRHIFYN